MKLTITRHGRTIENEAGILQGHLPGNLSSLGIEQAKRLALRLSTEHFDFIYSSDLLRASDTAKAITKFHPNTPIIFVENLRERNLGNLQGKTKIEIGWDLRTQKSTLIEMKNYETDEDVYKRAEFFLNEIHKNHLNDSVLFVCHSFVSIALMAVILGKKATEIHTLENPGNTSISIFEIDEAKFQKTICINCMKHLNN